MEKLSFYIALWSAKAAQLALRIIRKGGTTAPGRSRWRSARISCRGSGGRKR